jgi:hypothetical protein
MKSLGIIGVDFHITDELLIFSAFVRYWRKNGSTMRQHIGYDFKKAMIQLEGKCCITFS